MHKTVRDQQNKALRVLLRALRQDKKVSQQALALRLGKPQSFVRQIEAGNRTLDVPELLAVCAALDASPTIFIRT